LKARPDAQCMVYLKRPDSCAELTMTLNAEIVDDRHEEYEGKKGHVRTRRLTLRDVETPPFLALVDYEPKGDDVNSLPIGKSVGKTVQLKIKGMRFLMNRYLLEGSVTVSGNGTANPVGK